MDSRILYGLLLILLFLLYFRYLNYNETFAGKSNKGELKKLEEKISNIEKNIDKRAGQLVDLAVIAKHNIYNICKMRKMTAQIEQV